MGIKLPWTLGDEDNWKKTHRLAGYLWILGGVALCVGSFFPLATRWLLLSTIVLVSGVPAVYSYSLYRKNLSE